MNPVTIRPYRPEDRDRLRKIALDTADLGFRPDENIPFPDEIADILTRYYTDYEPESAWVADSRPVGTAPPPNATGSNGLKSKR